MDGKELLNKTLRLNAAFSLLSGICFMIFDEKIVTYLTGDHHPSIFLLGAMLVGFAVFVFAVSMMKNVNNFLVIWIIASDILWVVGSVGVVFVHYSQIHAVGKLLILLVAAVIGVFATFQTIGLRRHKAA